MKRPHAIILAATIMSASIIAMLADHYALQQRRDELCFPRIQDGCRAAAAALDERKPYYLGLAAVAAIVAVAVVATARPID